MLNVPQTIRFVVANPEARWPNLTEHERAICAERMRPFMEAWPLDLQEEFKAAVQSSPDYRFHDLLLKMADDIEAQDKRLTEPVPPRTFNHLKSKETYSAAKAFPATRPGADDHKQHKSSGR